MRIALAVAVVALTACNGNLQTGIHPAYMDNVPPPSRPVYAQGTVFPDCNDAEPGFTCGLIAPQIMSPQTQAHFVEHVCHEAVASDGCVQRFADMFVARLEERYPEADQRHVTRWCRAYPEECQDSVKVEREWLKSNNVHALERHDSRVAEEARAQAEIDAARRAAVGAIVAASFRSWGTAMQQQPTVVNQTVNVHVQR